METILDREKSKEQKERLAYVLSQKLARKFGTKHTTIIDFFVDEFLSSHGKINGEDLLILEKEISNAINTKISKPPSANGRKEELEEKKDDVREVRDHCIIYKFVPIVIVTVGISN